MTNTVNIAAYEFVALDNLPALRDELRGLCLSEDLRGTILLSAEGVNVCVAGSRAAIDALLARLVQPLAVLGTDPPDNEDTMSRIDRQLRELREAALTRPMRSPDDFDNKSMIVQVSRKWSVGITVNL